MRRFITFFGILFAFSATFTVARGQNKEDLVGPGALERGMPGGPATCSGNAANLMFPLDGTYALVDFCGDGATGSGPAECGGGAGAQNNDDDSATVPLPFTFDLYSDLYTTAFVNNNGNLSFVTPFSTFTASGFPSASFQMVAPFWGDVDTGNQSTTLIGDVWMKFFGSNTLVVTWDNVGYYNEHGDLLNTFQVAISDGTNPAMGLGNNVCFSWDNMCWTTGDASGGVAGVGGTPATVGVNRGDGVEFFQIGRFDHEGVDYDGPFGNSDGVSFLDSSSTCFSTSVTQNIAPIAQGFPPANKLTVDAQFNEIIDHTVQFISPEAGQTVTVAINDVNGAQVAGLVIGSNSPQLEVVTIDLDWAPDCNDVGTYVLEFTATDDFNPPGQTLASLEINVNCTVLTGACCGSDPINPNVPVCTEGVTQADCEGAGDRYGGDGSTCLTIDPPCVLIPAISEWGLVVLTLIGLAAGTVVFGRMRRQATA